MSKESSQWLNTMTLIGDTDRRGNAWHYRASSQGVESNHYPGAIPVEDVRRRLFDWDPVSVPVYVRIDLDSDDAIREAKDNGQPVFDEILMGNHHLTGEPKSYQQYYTFLERPGRQAITASDDYSADFNIPKSGYQIHGYREWLIDNVSKLIDGDTHISSAGLLKSRANAWVEIGIDEVMSVAGFEFRPHLLAFTSVDGTLATSYKRTNQAVVCDNTLEIASQENGQTVKVRHSKNSRLRLANARDALGLIIATADDFSAEVQKLIEWDITGKQFNAIVNELIPLNTDDSGIPLSKAAETKAVAKRTEVMDLWANDERCAPWKGTAFGVVQTFNTWNHHFKSTRGATVRAERNMLDAIKGTTALDDMSVLQTLAKVAV